MLINRELSDKIKIVNFFSILMVVFIHAYNLKDDFLVSNTVITEGLHVSSFIQYFISNGLARFAVPLFFMISGYLFFNNLEARDLGRKIWKRFQTVYLVFLLWALISFLFTYVFQAWSVTSAAAIGGNDTNVIIGVPFMENLKNYFDNPAGEQLWFLRHLFRLVILSPIIYFLMKKLYIVAIPVLAFIWFFEIQYMVGDVYLLNNEGVLFFALGGFLALHNIELQRKPKKMVTNICVAVWLILLIVKTCIAGSQDLGLAYMHKISELLGIVSVWLIYDSYIEGTSFKAKLLKVTPYTFFIYLFHEPLQGMIRYLIRGAVVENINTLLLGYLVAPIISISVCLGLGILLQRYLPQVYNIITGGRGKKKKLNTRNGDSVKA